MRRQPSGRGSKCSGIDMADLQKPHTDGLIPPHGGRLNPRLVQGSERSEILEKACGLQRVALSTREESDLVLLGSGAYSPLAGFLCGEDYRAVLDSLHLADGTLWPLPVTVSISSRQAALLSPGEEVALVSKGDSGSDAILAIMVLQDVFAYDKELEAGAVFRTTDRAHPGVAALHDQHELYVGGPVTVVSEGRYPTDYPEYARPEETRRIFAGRGWTSVAAFQTRNPLHRSHEYLMKTALETSDGLLLHPVVGRLKPGDIPAEVRMRCYRVLLERYFPQDRVVLSVYPLEMRYAGPREALLHAVIRQNFGCNRIIIGSDHAGVGSYYGPFDAQSILDEIPDGELAIAALKLDHAFWCRRCGGMASRKTCPHPEADHMAISGTELRAMLSAGRLPPAEFSRPEVIDILKQYYRREAERPVSEVKP